MIFQYKGTDIDFQVLRLEAQVFEVVNTVDIAWCLANPHEWELLE